MILYFTGTGNSRYAASVIAAQTGEEPVSINEIMRERIINPYAARYSFDSQRPFVFVCPTYCWCMPRVVERFIRESRLTGSRDVYFYLTCGSDTGSASKHAEALCQELGYNFMGLGSVKMPENYICMFSSPSCDEAQGIILAARSQIESAGRLINFSKPISDANAGQGINAQLTRLGNPFYKFFVNDKKYFAGDNCIGCGKCRDICPLVNISLEDGRPVWHGSCTQCQACISVCPVNAIEYGSKSKGKRRYYLFPDGRQKQESGK